MNRRKATLILIFLFGISCVLLVFVLLRSSGSAENIESVETINNGNKLIVNADGTVTYFDANGATYQDYWSNEKTNAYFQHFESNYQGEAETVSPWENVVTVTINGKTYTYVLKNPEITDAAGDDATNPDDSGDNGNDNNNGGNSGGSGNPTPTPTAFPKPSKSPTPTPTPYSGGGSPFAECLFWRLSYCVTPIVTSPTPTPSSTPTTSADPDANVIKVSNCEEYIAAGNTDPTIISNEVCIPD